MSMKPNEFIMNTDYLSIAQIGKNEITMVINSGTLSPGEQRRQQADYTIYAEDGAIDQIMLSSDGNSFVVGSTDTLSTNGTDIGTIYVFRTSRSNIRVVASINNTFSPDPLTYPTITYKIKISSFRPPNIF